MNSTPCGFISGGQAITFVNDSIAVRWSQIGCLNSFQSDGVPVQGQELDLVGRSLSVNVHNNTNIARLQSKVWQGLFESNLRVHFKHYYL